ncbi:MAG: transporter [Coxiella sp. RIFCSPHIGHO2_12_FULL_42_15]|nr:MAG: transporter [Coxiella sp. RIFCSPHIGHO2_12_FULL_42_15]
MVKEKRLLQDQWSSKLGFILAATGAAVGLGNIWRFPYMAGTHGGSAFVLLYVVFVLIIGIPIMLAEFLIGRHARQDPVDALRDTAVENHHSRHWGLLGWWGALGLVLVLSFYSVVSGWSIAYIFKSISGSFNNLDPNAIHTVWQQFLANPWQLLLWHTVFMILTMGVIIAGVQQGLERSTKLMMPALYIILFSLVIYACDVGHCREAFRFLFKFDHDKITGSVVIAALGHAFFTLALGAGALLTYGAYIPRKVKLVNSVFIIVGLDVLVAVLSGMAIFPLVFAYHLPPTAGPGLMFETLPISFAHMHLGGLIGALFFLLLLFAAWTSSINIAEPLIVILMNRLTLSRAKSVVIVGSIAWVLGIGSLLSFNVWQNVRLFSNDTVFDIATNLPTNILLPLGGLGFAIFAGWVMSRHLTEFELSTYPKVYSIWRCLIRYIAPMGVICIFVSAYL